MAALSKPRVLVSLLARLPPPAPTSGRLDHSAALASLARDRLVPNCMEVRQRGHRLRPRQVLHDPPVACLREALERLDEEVDAQQRLEIVRLPAPARRRVVVGTDQVEKAIPGITASIPDRKRSRRVLLPFRVPLPFRFPFRFQSASRLHPRTSVASRSRDPRHGRTLSDESYRASLMSRSRRSPAFDRTRGPLAADRGATVGGGPEVHATPASGAPFVSPATSAAGSSTGTARFSPFAR